MILRVFLTISSFIFVLTSCGAQVVQFGTCAQVETVKLFDIEKVIKSSRHYFLVFGNGDS